MRRFRTDFLILWGLLGLAVLLQQCADVVETDITNRVVFLFAPSNGSVLDSGAVTFVWEAVADATDYQLLVTSPNFDEPGAVWADTIVAGTNFTMLLDSGQYSWGVRAQNSVYATSFFVNDFTVRFGDANDQPVDPPALVAPGDGVSTDSGTINFVWEAVMGATSYKLRIATPTLEQPDLVLLDTSLSVSSFGFLLEDGAYEWGVRSENRVYQSAFARRSLTIASGLRDPLIPPELVSPSNNAVLDSGSVTLLWEAQSAAERYQVRILSPNFANAERTVQDSILTGNQLELVLDRGNYEWGVKASNSAFETEFITRIITVE